MDLLDRLNISNQDILFPATPKFWHDFLCGNFYRLDSTLDRVPTHPGKLGMFTDQFSSQEKLLENFKMRKMSWDKKKKNLGYKNKMGPLFFCFNIQVIVENKVGNKIWAAFRRALHSPSLA